MTKPCVDLNEIAKFNSLSHEWWDFDGKLKALHDFNPHRLNFIQKHTLLQDKTILDIGCGGGILCESLAKLGAKATGIDLAEQVINVARDHANKQCLDIDYQVIDADSLAQKTPHYYDIITCMELLEHVPNPEVLIQTIDKLLKPNGVAFFATINRTMKAYLFAIIGAEYVFRLLPTHTHDYQKFVQPSELVRWARSCDWQNEEICGLKYNPFSRTAKLCSDVSINYLMCFRKN